MSSLKLIIDAVSTGFHSDPGTSDLDDEQLIHIKIPLGIWRKANRLSYSEIGDAVECERLRAIINQCGLLTTGWKYGEEGFLLLKINRLLTGNSG